MTGPRILVVEHQDSCPPGAMGGWLTEAGARLDVVRPAHGEAVPATLDGDALLVLGGEMSSTDDDRTPWLPATRELVRDAARRVRPVLGICLGHQIAALALGGEVRPHPQGQTVGMRRVEATGALTDDELLPDLGGTPVVQWNGDVVTRMPESGVVLAHNAAGDVLLARYAPSVWGVQGHPEAGREIVGRWAEKDLADGGLNDVDVPATLAEVGASEADVARAWRLAAERFVALAARD